MRFVVIVLIMLFATGDVMADTSREDKIAYIIETEDFRGQIIAYKEEMIKRSIEELDKDAIDDLSEKQKSIIVEESAAIVEEYVDDYIKELVDVYEEHITDDEIDALYNFYRRLIPQAPALQDMVTGVARRDRTQSEQTLHWRLPCLIFRAR